MSVLVYEITKNISSFQKFRIKKIIQEVLERSLSNFLEEIEMRSTMCGMLTKNNIYNSEIFAKKKRFFEKYPIMEDLLITDLSY